MAPIDVISEKVEMVAAPSPAVIGLGCTRKGYERRERHAQQTQVSYFSHDSPLQNSCAS
jgi:hypothetical protein